jgi:hypothetical protein
MVVTPTRRWSCRISCRRWTRTFASRADRGSSSRSRPGEVASARDRDALLLAARQLGRVLVALLGQADQLEELPHAGPDRRARHPRVLEPVGDVLRRRQVREQRVGLEDDPEVAPRSRERGDVPAGLLDAPARLRIQTRDRAQERGLSASRRPEEADELALVDVERDAVEGSEVAESLGKLPNPEECGGRGSGGDRHREGSARRSRAPAGPATTRAADPFTELRRVSGYFFGSDFEPYRFSHSARILSRLSAAHWKSFLAMCCSMFVGRNSTGWAMEGIAVIAYPSL